MADKAILPDAHPHTTRALLIALTGSNIFALIVGGIYEYLSLRGVISMSAAWIVLVFVWLLGVIGIVISEFVWGKGIKHRIWWGTGASVVLGLILFGFNSVVSMMMKQPTDVSHVAIPATVINTTAPDLVPSIDTVITASPFPNSKDALMIVTGTISNRGADGTVADMEIDLKIGDRLLRGAPIPISEDAKITVGSTPLYLTGSEYWKYSALRKPVTSNSIIEEWNLVLFRGITREKIHKSLPTVIVTCVDVQGRKVTTERRMTGIQSDLVAFLGSLPSESSVTKSSVPSPPCTNRIIFNDAKVISKGGIGYEIKGNPCVTLNSPIAVGTDTGVVVDSNSTAPSQRPPSNTEKP